MNRIKNAALSVAAFLLAAALTPLVVLWVYVVGPTDDGTDWPDDDEVRSNNERSSPGPPRNSRFAPPRFVASPNGSRNDLKASTSAPRRTGWQAKAPPERETSTVTSGPRQRAPTLFPRLPPRRHEDRNARQCRPDASQRTPYNRCLAYASSTAHPSPPRCVNPALVLNRPTAECVSPLPGAKGFVRVGVEGNKRETRS